MIKKFRFYDTERKAYYDDEFYVGHDGCVYHHYSNHLNVNKNAIVEQYTGLKDKNGVEIYEGDIVRDDSATGIVAQGNSGLTVMYDVGSCYEWEYNNPLEWIDCVIGNVHENPELLEK